MHQNRLPSHRNESANATQSQKFDESKTKEIDDLFLKFSQNKTRENAVMFWRKLKDLGLKLVDFRSESTVKLGKGESFTRNCVDIKMLALSEMATA